MGDVGMIKGGACLVAPARSRQQRSLIVYRREEGEETMNTMQTATYQCMTRQVTVPGVP